MRLDELIRKTERRLRAARLHYGHGTDNPRDEAVFLVLRALGLPFDTDLAQPANPGRVEPLIRRRIRERTPAAYLLNEAWLCGVRFYVDRRAIIPRSHIAGLLAGGLRPWAPRTVRRILDLYTGSGCLAILAAQAFPEALIEAAELSSAALAVARRNVSLHHLKHRIKLMRSDLFAGLGRSRYDIIVTNPPYVSSAAMRRLPAEYRHEPGLALAAGRHGLDVVARILAEARSHLTKHGVLACEVGDGRSELEKAWPQTPFVWPQDEVFILTAASMAAQTRNAATPRSTRR